MFRRLFVKWCCIAIQHEDFICLLNFNNFSIRKNLKMLCKTKIQPLVQLGATFYNLIQVDMTFAALAKEISVFYEELYKYANSKTKARLFPSLDVNNWKRNVGVLFSILCVFICFLDCNLDQAVL